ncbi:fimbrial protein [Pseudomonas sp. Marseille-Q5115]|uniref:fimbrial protein n=1 Tax=Pseudomonas sp. Marseille-Q5115 TaxID=2866593 RepID=UPI001CE4989A|nr:fimbrial protein [Pseudomonas sp. Marseille-Q5115]
MKNTCLIVLGAALATAAAPSHARSPVTRLPDHGCYWSNGSGPMPFVRDFGVAFVARDAPPGAVIGQARSEKGDYQTNGEVECANMHGSSPPITFETTATAALVPPPPVNAPPYLPQRLLATNVPGIAVQIEYGLPFNGPAQYSVFTPVDGLPPIPPFAAVMHWSSDAFRWQYSGGYSYLTLVKTGPIAPGVHQVLPQVLYTGSFSDIGLALTFAVTGTVIQAQCDVGASTPSYVELGSWNRTHFTAPGTTTTEVPFALELENCGDDPNNRNTEIYLQFDPQRGSYPVDGANGIFSLTPASTAAGMGVQVLRGDGTPMPLNRMVQMQRLPGGGSTQLPFLVRFYQTGTPSEVTPGNADAYLGFTLSYL